MKKYISPKFPFIFLLSVAFCCGMAPISGAEELKTSPSFGETDIKFGRDKIQFNLVLELIVSTGASHEMGRGKNGSRRLIELTGGTFKGKGIKGIILPGGTDRQLLRQDKIRELDARYELLTDDGALIFVHNKVIIEPNHKEGQQRYARSIVTIEAPEGPYDWLNKRVIMGTLHSFRPEKPYVYLRFYSVE